MHDPRNMEASQFGQDSGPVATGIESPAIELSSIGVRNAFTAIVALIALYLTFAPVWTPRLTSLRYDNARLLQVGLLVALFAVLIVPGTARIIAATWRSLGQWPRILIATLLLGGTLSTLFSSAPKLGALETGLMSQLVFLFLCVVAGTRILGRRTDTILSLAIFAGAATLILQFWFIQTLYLVDGKAFPWISPFLEFANVRFFSQYQAYTLFLITLPLAIRRLTPGGKIFIYFVAANFWSLQWMVGGRAVWAGIASAGIMVLYCAGRGKSRWLIEQVCVILAGAAIFGAFTAFTQTTPTATPIPHQLSMTDLRPQSANERVIMAVAAIDQIRANPVLGVGPGQFGLHYSATPASHPHNSVLDLLSEYGLVAGTAGVILLGLLAYYAIRTIRNDLVRRQKMDPVNVAIGAALVAGLVDAMFSGNLVMPHSQVLLSVLAGWLFGRNLSPKNLAHASLQHRGPEALIILSWLAVSTLIVLILSFEYLVLMQEMPYWLPERFPNFWQNGRFSAW